jgi:hypothetical protein
MVADDAAVLHHADVMDVQVSVGVGMTWDEVPVAANEQRHIGYHLKANYNFFAWAF